MPDEIALEQAGTMLAREAVKQAEEIIKPKTKKLNTKLKLQEATEALEETIEVIPVVKKSKLQTKKIKEIETPKDVEVVEESESINIIPAKKKKTTRKNKVVDFEIEDDEK